MGQPKNKTQQKRPTYAASMAAAAKMLDLPLSEVKRAKASGSKAFRDSRVYLNDLVQWLKDNPATPGDLKSEDLKTRRLRGQVDKLELEVARERGKVIDRGLVKEEWGRNTQKLFDILDKSLDRSTYNVIAKEFKGYLSSKA